MRISASSYSFNRLLKEGKETQFSVISIAKDIGFDDMEFVDILPPEGVSKEEYALKLKGECERLGMEISSYTFGADLLKETEEEQRAEIERVKKQVDIAEILGVKVLRHDATFDSRGLGFDVALPRLSEACREITEYAEAKGIKTTVENHGHFCQDSIRVEKLYNAVNHPNFGLLCDMGNFVCVDEDPAIAVSRVAPYAFYVHAKDFHLKSGEGTDPGEGYAKTRGGNYRRGAIVGHGDVPVKSCLSALKMAGYKGGIAIEFEGMEDNITALKIGLANLKRYIEEVGL